jgi:hypothetical protein
MAEASDQFENRGLASPDDHLGQFVSARVYETKSQMVSGASEQSDRVTLAQRLLRYYAGSSAVTASDRDVISEHMGHLCVFYVK